MKKNSSIVGTLRFSLKRVLLVVGETLYYVKWSHHLKWYVHGDTVRARIVKGPSGTQLPEVRIVELLHRTREDILARRVEQKWSPYWSILPEYGSLELPIREDSSRERKISNGNSKDNTVYSISIDDTWEVEVLSVFWHGELIQEQVILHLAWVRDSFPSYVEQEASQITHDRVYSTSQSERRDLRDWYIFTIDGAHAKDLDDAISLQRLDNWNILLWVHIADVSHYVRDHTELDREAYRRWTSIYTPMRVIPMLPSALSDELCSLHPWSPKLTISCIIEVDHDGNVQHTEVYESIIESRYRGVYEDLIDTYMSIVWWEISIDGVDPRLCSSLHDAAELYQRLVRRRRGEWKIIFDSTELEFAFPTDSYSEYRDTNIYTPISIYTRKRNELHMLIEEFMVLANEQIAKWCSLQGIPFLSRIHDLPWPDQISLIRGIVSQKLGQHDNQGSSYAHKKPAITSRYIRDFLDMLSPEELYIYSRLLLPKMSKAVYGTESLGHFGLWLEYYAHFTSPIRRYPDLQVHRIIKEYLHGILSSERREHYQSLLRRVARQSSQREQIAEWVEQAIQSIYIARYMEQYVWVEHIGQVSGVSEFAYFVELESGVEAVVPLQGRWYRVDQTRWILYDVYKKKVSQIGERLLVRIDRVDRRDNRVIATPVLPLKQSW